MSNQGPASAQSSNAFAVINSYQLLFVLRGANFQIAQDQQFTKVFTGVQWDPQFVVANWTGGAFNTSCAGGIFSAPNKGGSAIVAVGQSWAGLTGASTQVNATVQASTTTFTVTPYFNLSTPNSGVLTGDIFIFGFCLD